MAVLQNAIGQGLKFSGLTAINTIKTFSILIRANATSWDSLDSGQNARLFSGRADAYASGNDIGFDLLARNSAFGGAQIRFEVGWSGGVASWSFNYPSTGVLHSIMITYAGTATSANPIAYVDGVSVTITENTSPSGTWAGLKNVLKIGNRDDTVSNYAHTFNGSYLDARIYDAIKTPAQAALVASENINTDDRIDESDLIFHAPLTMCKGLTYPTYVGSVLETANEFYDRINGYVGVPSGEPIGA